MWRWLLIALLPNFTLAVESSSPTSVGPTSETEARVLWDDGRKAFTEHKYLDAANLLSRLVARYPGSAGATDGGRMLGVSYLELHQPKKALEPLRNFVETKDLTLDGQLARLELCRAYFENHRLDETYLTADTALQRLKKIPGAPPEIRSEAMLWKAQAMIPLKRGIEAEEVLELVKKELEAHPSAALKSHAGWIELQIRNQKCSRFPSPGPLEEAQIRDQLNRRGDCLQQTALVFKESLQSQQTYWGDQIFQKWLNSFEQYRQAALKPPRPPGRRSSLELKRYLGELSPILFEDFRKKTTQTIEIIELNKEQMPKDVIPYITRAALRLKELCHSL